jgi:stearoyl-CoA desaturase (delta-9 desaturase)
VLTGGEAFHDHHHEDPASALHLPRRGVVNRLVDYNGTALLVFEKLRWARNLKIAPQSAAQPGIAAPAE